MNNFEIVFRGYDKDQVKAYFDKVIDEYERLLNEKKESDKRVAELSDKLDSYQNLESTLNRALFNAENAGDEIKKMARKEAEVLINDARRNANRIINDALIKAEKAGDNADRLKRNTERLKRRLKGIIEGQLDIIDEIDNLDFRDEEY